MLPRPPMNNTVCS